MHHRLRRDVIAAVLLSAAAAAIADMRPPELDDAAGFIVASVGRHHAAPPAREDRRHWAVAAEFDACTVDRRTEYEVQDFGTWRAAAAVARWDMSAVDPAAIAVTTEVSDGKEVHVVLLPCASGGECVETAAGRRRDVRFEFTSSIIARRVAAAFRYAADLCTVHPAAEDRILPP